MTLEVALGKTYKDGLGREVKIIVDRAGTCHPNPFKYRYIGDQGKSYSPDGSCGHRNPQFSLVSEA